MSIIRTLAPSVATLGFAAAILGLGFACALSPAWAEGPSCEKEIAAVTQAANQQADAAKKEKALNYLAEAKDELADEGDEEDCISQVDKAKKLLGL
ncbi:MAG TPA: hypothetical protein VHA10_14280 [Hypericibacter adhaerens]|jgi:hypothetical protein|uniref:Uncharacterized protein n=1 Tax=Hypericibacter adhaerens TaxID=2602016 RepID=A0A5J6N719_9PROT|nr:hypothetical protein [Hypericibacter adhaerens]QEX24795.1 hypothetical protein FRZ61_47370 [Hypericibacter adhaerens]HWA44377.1 hypothetical protein [Hypericibacter adhaerens]